MFGWGRFNTHLSLKVILIIHWALINSLLSADEAQDAHQQVYGQQDDQGYDNQAKFSHELIAGAASFEGFKLYEDHQRKEGMPFPFLAGALRS